METSDYIVAGLVAALTGILLIFQNAIISASNSIGVWMFEFGATYGYLGAFLISVFGNFTIVFPIPYSVAIVALGAYGLDPILLGLSAGLGATIGELSSYLLGRGMSMAQLEEKYGHRLKKVRQLVEEYGYFAVFLFAATPLPDDMVMIPAGIIGLSLPRVILASFLGKVLLAMLLAYAGRYSITIVESMIGEDNPYSMVITLAGIIIISYLTIRVDWYKLWRDIRTSKLFIRNIDFLALLNPMMWQTYFKNNSYLSIAAIVIATTVISFIANIPLVVVITITASLFILAITTYFEHKRVINQLEEELY
ncbi:MAG: YqaA family protein [Candidatus Asgardarchaeia archaeon]